MKARVALDWPAIRGNVIALWAALLVLSTLHAVAVHAAWSHQAAHQAWAAFR